MPIQYVLQAPTLDKLQEFLPTFMQKVNESPVFQMADVNLRFTKPEARIEIDRDKASLLGVSTRNIAQTLQYALSGQRMGYFYMNGKQYQILGEINRQQRNTPVDLKSIYVRSNNGEMIQLDNLVKVTENVAPPQLYRYNRFVSATVSSGLNKGYTIGDGLDEMDRIASEVLDGSFRTALSGELKEFRESSSSLMFADDLGLADDLFGVGRPVREFQGPVGSDVHRAFGYRRCVDVHELFGYHDEYIQPDRYHYVDWFGGEERYLDRRVRQSAARVGT